jgi:DNA invertase Pin-like site-specific DNA recombinase
MSEAAVIRKIESAAKKRKKADAAKQKATKELRRSCAEAQAAGVPVTRIAEKAGLSRQGVYDLLGEQPSS